MNDFQSIHSSHHMLGIQGSNSIPPYNNIGTNIIHPSIPIMNFTQQTQNLSLMTGSKNNVFTVVKD